MSAARHKVKVVVDGSNIATEGRQMPSLAQLRDALEAFGEEYPSAELIVVADATFEHRATASERASFASAVLKGDIVTPPAGAIGRGDGFILKIAARVGAIVLSNDSFQEFQGEHPWLFEDGRLIGGKPVRGVGWIFTPRLPVRGAKSPSTLERTGKAAAESTPSAKTKVSKSSETDATISQKAHDVAPAPAKKTRQRRAATKSTESVVTKKAPRSVTKKPVAKAQKVSKARPPKKELGESPNIEGASSPALRRERTPVNSESDFARFIRAHSVGAKVKGVVKTFTSHGAIIEVKLRGGVEVECYAPTSLLAVPAPVRARDVLVRGEQRTFQLRSVDLERRVAELACA